MKAALGVGAVNDDMIIRPAQSGYQPFKTSGTGGKVPSRPDGAHE
jgi:hypothetical protein